MIIEGINAVSEALSGEQTVDKIVVEKGNFSERLNRVIALARTKGIKVIFLDKPALLKLSATSKTQGVIAYTTEFKYSEVDEILFEKSPALILILDGIEDPHNLGAIIRTAECSGANGIILGKHRSATVTDTVVKVSAGASSHVKIAKVTNLNDTIRYLKDNGVFVLTSDMDGESVYKTDLTGNIAVVIGNEGSGVHSLTRKLSDGIISLPQMGKINSLNASVAAGIILYETLRQRLK